MSSSALLMVTAAALLHAGWNALTKRACDPLAFLWSSMIVAALGLLPFAAVVVMAAPFPASALRYVVASSAIHAVYFVALSAAYRHGELSIVYPIARGLGVALVPLVAFVLLAERVSMLGAGGIALVVVGIVVSGVLGNSGAAARVDRGVIWAIATGLCITAYSLVDSAGARHAHPVPYLFGVTIGAVAGSAPFVLHRRAVLVAEWRKNVRTILLASTMNLSGYLLVLWAYRSSNTAYVVACRELSIALSPLLGRLLLDEKRMAPRLAGAGIILGGVVCVALAR